MNDDQRDEKREKTTPESEEREPAASADGEQEVQAVVDEESQPAEEPAEEEPTLEEQLRAAQAEAAEYLDGWQRARAEFANARKRLEKSRIEARRNATVEVIAKLLPILDDFQRALENVPAEIAEDSWFEGVALVYRKLNSILEGENIERIPAVGEPFDPNFHEAVLKQESDEYDSGVVISELQAGYRLGERVVRPAMVVVAD